MKHYYATAEDYLNEAAAVRAARTPWHRTLLAACRKRSVFFKMHDDGKVELSEYGTRVPLGTFENAPAAIRFVDQLPIKETNR